MKQSSPEPRESDGETEFERFKDLAKKLLHIPKREADPSQDEPDQD